MYCVLIFSTIIQVEHRFISSWSIYIYFLWPWKRIYSWMMISEYVIIHEAIVLDDWGQFLETGIWIAFRILLKSYLQSAARDNLVQRLCYWWDWAILSIFKVGLLDRGADAGKAHRCSTVKENARTFCSLYGRRSPIVFPFLFFIFQNFLFSVHPLLENRFMYISTS